jgi:hypothetical protein
MSIEAMKQALEALEEIYRTGDTQAFDLCYAPNVIPALRQAIAEAEMQEPVAWMWKDGTLTSDPDFADGTWTPLFAAPVHASDMSEEHVHKSDKDTLIKQAEEAFESAKEKGWVGLTDEDINFYWAMATEREAERHFPTGHHAFASLIQDKLKRLNT